MSRTSFLLNECKRKNPISQKKRKNSFTLLFLSNLMIVYIQRPTFKSTISCTAGVILVRIILIHTLYRLLTIQGTLKRCKISQEKTISHPFEGVYTSYMLYQNNCNVPYDMLFCRKSSGFSRGVSKYRPLSRYKCINQIFDIGFYLVLCEPQIIAFQLEATVLSESLCYQRLLSLFSQRCI